MNTPPVDTSHTLTVSEAAHEAFVQPFLDSLDTEASTKELKSEYTKYIKVLSKKIQSTKTLSDKKIIISARNQVRLLMKNLEN